MTETIRTDNSETLKNALLRIKALEEQIEKMKNGDNCKYGCIACGNYICDLGLDNCNSNCKCDKWELAE